MKNTKKGFIVPLLIAIIAVLAIGGGVYYFSKTKNVPSEVRKSESWNGTYTYEEFIPPNISMDLNLVVASSSTVLRVDGYMTEVFVNATTKEEDGGLVVIFDSYRSGDIPPYTDNKVGFTKGNVLFTINKDDQKYIATWGRIKSNYIDQKTGELKRIEQSDIVVDQTAGQKTYLSTKYNFEFKYPTGATVGEYSNKYNGEQTAGVAVDYSENKTNLNRPIFNVRVFEKNINDAIKLYAVDEKILKDQVYKSAFITGRAISISMSIGDVNNITMVEHDGRTFVLSNKTAEDSGILSTFKFTAPTTQSTSSWKTYTQKTYTDSSVYNFQIKYPASFKAVAVEGMSAPSAYITTFMPVTDMYIPGEKLPKNAITVRHLLSQDELSRLQRSSVEQLLIKDVVYDGSGKHPASFTEFKNRTIGGNDFYYIETGRFEGVLGLKYYLINQYGVYSFELLSTGIDWTNPKYDVEKNDGHVLLKEMLETIAFIN